MKISVTGATGFIGRKVVEKLSEKNQVIAVVRSKEKAKELNAEVFKGSLLDSDFLEKAFSGCDCVIHLAAVLGGKTSEKELWKTNFEGTEKVLKASETAGVKHFVFASSAGVYGARNALNVNESFPKNPKTLYEKSKLEGEELVKKSGIDFTIIQPTTVYGKGDKSNFASLLKGIPKSYFRITGNGENFFHTIHVSDVVKTFSLAVGNRKGFGESFLIAEKKPLKFKEIVEIVRKSAGVEEMPSSISANTAKAAALLFSPLRAIGLKVPLRKEGVEFLTNSSSFDSSKAEKVLGFRAEKNFAKAFEEEKQWYLS